MRLTMLVPTRGRPENARRLRDAIRETAPDVDLRFGVDRDDPNVDDYRDLVEDQCSLLIGPPPSRSGMVEVVNRMISHIDPDVSVIGFMGDDHCPRTAAWDKAMCDAIAGKPAALAYGNDLLQGERIPTAVAMTASIPRALGYMAPPELAHLYVDNVWLDWGRGLDAIMYLPDVVIEHLHPAAGKAVRDAGYEATNAPAVDAADKAAYLRYRSERLSADLDKLRALS